MDEIIQITVAHPKSHLDELRRAFGVPDEYTDEALLQALIGIVIDDYMNVEKIEAENLQDVLTDGIISKRWLDKNEFSKGISEMTREEVVEELISAFIENTDIDEIARDGVAEHKGYENMNNDELKIEYEDHFSEKIKIVEKEEIKFVEK